MEHSLYPVPPRFTVRRLVLMDLAAICTLYGACGRDTAWGTRETVSYTHLTLPTILLV